MKAVIGIGTNMGERYDNIENAVKALSLVPDLSADLVPKNSLIREFIGGGIFGE